MSLENSNDEIQKMNMDESEEKTEMDSVKTEEKTDYNNLSEEEILKIKAIRAGLEEEETEEEEKVPDTLPRKILKKIDHFWEYYKWFVIIPIVIIVIVVIFITTYLEENKEVTLDVSVMNATSILDTIAAVEQDYPEEYGIDTKAYPIRIEYNLQFPDTDEDAASIDESILASIQKFNAMVLAGRVDVVFTNTWVVDGFSETGATTDLREIFDEEYLEEHSDRIYWYESYEGTRIPVAFYVDDTTFLGELADGEPAVIATFNTGIHKEESVRFMKWVITNCENNK